MMRRSRRSAAAASQIQRGTRVRVVEYDDVWLTLECRSDGLTKASTFVGTKYQFKGPQIVFSGCLCLAFSEQSIDQVLVTIDDTGVNQGIAGIGP